MDEERKNEEHQLRMEQLRIKIAHAKEKIELQKILVTTLKAKLAGQRDLVSKLSVASSFSRSNWRTRASIWGSAGVVLDPLQ
ncbi:hypothetical protein TNCV_1182481 [Trichonephila clavipes]|nr:hypothetical protein TNCV_1182481 [Trichonephila clavipes]